MTDKERGDKDKLEVSGVVLVSVLSLFLTVFGWGWSTLSGRVSEVNQVKLDKSAYEEHLRTILLMQGDISRIRDILERHASHFGGDGARR